MLSRITFMSLSSGKLVPVFVREDMNHQSCESRRRHGSRATLGINVASHSQQLEWTCAEVRELREQGPSGYGDMFY